MGSERTPVIKENKELEQYFLNKLTEKYSENREDIHVSDLVYCLKEVCFRKYLKRPINIESLMFFLDGEQRHSGFQGLVPNLSKEDKLTKYGIRSSVDLFNPENDAPANKVIEIKTTRKKPEGEIPSHYLRQGAYYCILRGTREFTLMIQHINHNKIMFLDIKFTKKELNKYKKEMLDDYNSLKSVYDLIDKEEDKEKAILKYVSFLSEIREDMKWKCKYCLYNDLCYPKGNNQKV